MALHDARWGDRLVFSAKAWHAIDAGDSYRVIPWQIGVVAKLLRNLPNAWFDRLSAGQLR